MNRSCTRRVVLMGGLAGIGAALSARAQQPPTRAVPRIGFLLGEGYPGLLQAFHSELTRLGYVQDRNIAIVQRLGRPNTDDTRRQAAELAGMNLDLIVASALPHALLVRAANPNVPMVIGTGAGLICNGFGRTMERPGGNATGMEELPPGLTGRRLELLKTAAPHLRRVGLLSTTPATCGHDIQLADAISAAARLEVAVQVYRATNSEQVGQALAAMARDGQHGFANFQGGLSLGNRQMIVDFAAEHRLPAIYQAVLFAEAGGLMTWAPDQNEQLRIAARYVDRILRGANPGSLPILHPERYFLTLNRQAAQRIGLNFPPALLDQADRVIG
jgi:putative ABC transport system substrate-binding protein